MVMLRQGMKTTVTTEDDWFMAGPSVGKALEAGVTKSAIQVGGCFDLTLLLGGGKMSE